MGGTVFSGSRRAGTAMAVLAAWGLTFEAVGGSARADSTPPDWFVLKSWSAMEGLPQGSVTGIVQSRDGYLWLGTSGGAVRFDGIRFTVFDDRNPKQLLENEVKAILAASDGSIWIGVFGGGVSRYHQGHFTVYTTDNGLLDNFVGALAEDRQGNIWIGSDRGLTQFGSGRFRHFTETAGTAGRDDHVHRRRPRRGHLVHHPQRRSGGLSRRAVQRPDGPRVASQHHHAQPGLRSPAGPLDRHLRRPLPLQGWRVHPLRDRGRPGHRPGRFRARGWRRATCGWRR